MNPDFRSGSTTGTGAAIHISLGFIPNYVRIVNVTDGDTIDEWFSTMAAGTSITTSAAAATRATNGISAYVGDGTTPEGFTIGSGISETAKVLAWYACRNGAGS